MRGKLPVLFLASLLLLGGAPIAAQGTEAGTDNTVTVPDAPKDVQFVLGTRAGTPAQNASSLGTQFDHIDILGVEVGQETENDFKLVLRLAALDPVQPNSGFPFRLVYFSYGGLDWLIFVGGCRQFGQSDAQAEVAGCLMYRDNPAASPRQVKTIPATKGEGAFTFTVSKTDIFNDQRLPAQYGQVLSNIYAYATQTYATTQFLPFGDPLGSVSAFDRAPDGGFSKLDYVFDKGSGGHGALGLTSPDPIRVSNGEATTIVYLATLHNNGDADLKVEITTSDVRPDWLVRVPALVTAPAQSVLEFPVVLTMPFSHDHGKTIMFKVKATAVEDPKSFAELPLGVWWTDVPQPSAHHNGEMWFHSAPAEAGGFPEAATTVAPFKQYWINSIEDDPNPNANDEDAPAFFNDYLFCPFFGGQGQPPNPANCRTPPNFTASWFFPLSPSLLIGLDFDVAKQGLLMTNILASLPATTATLEVELRYCDPEEGLGGGRGQGFNQNATACNNYSQVLARGSQTRALSARTKGQFEVPLQVETSADYLPFKRGANIGLRVRLVTDLPQNLILTEPRPLFEIKTSRLYLPLIEFHDSLEDEYLELGAIKVTPLDPYEKKLNAGRTALYRFDVENNDQHPQRLRFTVEGVNAEWARVVGETEVPLEPKQKTNFTVAVTAPGDAQAEERAELIVVAQSLAEESATGIGRLRAVVVNDDIPDEAGMIQETVKKDTPAIGVAGLLAALVAAVLVARRRD